MQNTLKQAGDADVQKHFTELLQLEEFMEPNDNILGNLQCNDPKRAVSYEDYHISLPMSQGRHLDFVSFMCSIFK